MREISGCFIAVPARSHVFFPRLSSPLFPSSELGAVAVSRTDDDSEEGASRRITHLALAFWWETKAGRQGWSVTEERQKAAFFGSKTKSKKKHKYNINIRLLFTPPSGRLGFMFYSVSIHTRSSHRRENILFDALLGCSGMPH